MFLCRWFRVGNSWVIWNHPDSFVNRKILSRCWSIVCQFHAQPIVKEPLVTKELNWHTAANSKIRSHEDTTTGVFVFALAFALESSWLLWIGFIVSVFRHTLWCSDVPFVQPVTMISDGRGWQVVVDQGCAVVTTRGADWGIPVLAGDCCGLGCAAVDLAVLLLTVVHTCREGKQ